MGDTISVSYSRLSLFLKCTQAYYAKYILKIPDPGNDKARLGNCIHDIYELVSTPSKQAKRKKYVLHSIETGELHPVMIRLYGRKFKSWNIKEIVYSGKTQEETNLKELGLTLLHNGFVSGYDAGLEVLDVEKTFKIQVSENVFITGFIDKVSKIDDNTIEIVDYKSGVPFSMEKCQEEHQPLFYKIAAKKLYEGYKIILFSYHFLKNRKIVTVPIEDAKLKNFLKFIIAQGILMLKFDEKSAIPNRDFHCKFCAFKQPNKETGYTGCPAFYDKNGKSNFKQ